MLTNFEMKAFESLTSVEMIEEIQRIFGERLEKLTGEDKAVLVILLIEDNITISNQITEVDRTNLNSNVRDFFKMAKELSLIDGLKLTHTLICQILQENKIVIW